VDNETVFWAIVGKVQTMADGGIRVYLDLPESAIVQAAELMAYKREGVVLDVVCRPKQEDGRDEPDAGAKQPRKIHI